MAATKILFMGTAEFAVPSLIGMVDAGYNVATVVTQPDRPRGRGRQLSPSPVKQAAERRHLPVLQPARLRDGALLKHLTELKPDLLVVAAYGRIVPASILSVPQIAPINVHGSLLPRYRGAAPIQRAIMAGETVSGVTTIWMDASLDTGDILMQEAVPIGEQETAGELTERLATIGATLLMQTISGLQAGTCRRIPQDHTMATLAPALTDEDGEIRWEESAPICRNRIRGVNPRPGAFARIRNVRVKIWSAAEIPGGAAGEPGEVVQITKSPPGLLVAAGNSSALLLTEVQPESGKRMSGADWARGLRLAPGERFIRESASED